MTRIIEVKAGPCLAPLIGAVTNADATRLKTRAKPGKETWKKSMDLTESRNLRKPLLRVAFVLALALAAALGAVSTAAVAQDQPGAEPAALTEVVITGSRIKGNPDVASANPITVVSSIDLQNSNSTDIQSVLSKLPSVGTNGLSNAESSNFGGNGFEFVDLRNLGPQRTLVLVDGQRFVTSANSGAFAGVDFNNIPTEFVDHVEVLRDGASPVYGSDAVAGVINIITKQHFNGVELNASAGSTDKWDKKTYSASATMGTDFDRGNIVFNLGYNKTEPIFQRDRDFARSINGSANSGFFPNGVYAGTNPDGSTYRLMGDGHGGFSPAPAAYDTTQVPNLFGGSVRKTFNTSGHYELNPGSEQFPVQFVGQFMYTDRSSFGLANPDPQVGVANTPTGVGTNENIGGLPGPLTPDSAGGNSSSFAFRSPVIGPREFLTDVQTYRSVTGFQGTLLQKFDWELKLIHGQSSGEAHTLNLVDQPNLATFTGDINNLTPADLTLLRDNTTDILKTTEDEYTTQVSGPIHSLPAGDLTFALGGDIRREALTDTPDFANATGRTDQGGTPTHGEYNLKEGFVELNVPILKDQFLAKELSFDGAARYSHYSNFGNATTWKGTLNWAPVEDFRIRSTLSTSFRAPTIQELFLANTTLFNGVNDPCDTNPKSNSLLVSSSGAAHATVLANCVASLSAVGVNPATFAPSAGGSQQIAGISGGNPNLTPERTHDFTIGAVLTPTFVQNLQMTVDYWRIKLSNQIIQVPDAQTALNVCYASVGLSDPNCASLGPRTPVPISNQPTAGGISSQNLTSLNSGTINTDGIDIGFDYNFPLSDFGLANAGKVSFSDTATVTLSFRAADQSGTVNDFLGKIQQTSSPFTSANPKLGNRLTSSWSNDSFSFAWSARSIGSVKRFTDPNAPAANCSVAGDCLPAIWYSDIVATYKYQRLTIIAGVDNLFDKQPPFFIDSVGRTNSNPFVYDYVGRFMFLKVVAKL
jgi:iron complex outermembrane receptor protein